MTRRFQFSLSTLFWAMLVAAVFCGSWRLARYWLGVGPIEATFPAALISLVILSAVAFYVDFVNTPLDELDD